MSISSWLNNTKVLTSLVEHQGYKFLIYTTQVGSHSVALIEEVQSNIRKVPTNHPRIESSADMDNFVRQLMDEIIEENF
jgi:hypothetical protein